MLLAASPAAVIRESKHTHTYTHTSTPTESERSVFKDVTSLPGELMDH